MKTLCSLSEQRFSLILSCWFINAKCRDFINCIYYYFNMCHVYIYIYIGLQFFAQYNSIVDRKAYSTKVCIFLITVIPLTLPKHILEQNEAV